MLLPKVLEYAETFKEKYGAEMAYEYLMDAVYFEIYGKNRIKKENSEIEEDDF